MPVATRNTVQLPDAAPNTPAISNAPCRCEALSLWRAVLVGRGIGDLLAWESPGVAVAAIPTALHGAWGWIDRNGRLNRGLDGLNEQVRATQLAVLQACFEQLDLWRLGLRQHNQLKANLLPRRELANKVAVEQLVAARTARRPGGRSMRTSTFLSPAPRPRRRSSDAGRRVQAGRAHAAARQPIRWAPTGRSTAVFHLRASSGSAAQPPCGSRCQRPVLLRRTPLAADQRSGTCTSAGSCGRSTGQTTKHSRGQCVGERSRWPD